MIRRFLVVTCIAGVLGVAVATAAQRPKSGLPKNANKKEIESFERTSNQRSPGVDVAPNANIAPQSSPSGPPANDNCASATAVAVPSSTAGTNTGATADEVSDVEFCGASGSAVDRESVWYSIAGTGTTVTVSTCNAASDLHPDTKIGVFSGTCGALTCIDGNDDDCGAFNGLLSTVSFCAESGVDYLVNVRGFDPGDVGDFQIDVSDDGVPCSLPCNSAELIGGTDSVTRVDHPGWFTFLATGDVTAIETCGSTFDTGLEVFGGCPGASLASNDDCDTGFFGGGSDPNASCFNNNPNAESCFCFDTVPGTQYWVFAGEFDGDPPTPGETLVLTTEGKPNCGPLSACCEDASGTCFDDNPPGGCFAGETEYPNMTCADVEAANLCPDPILSACCDNESGECVDDQLPGTCLAGETEFNGQLCADIIASGDCLPAPPCPLDCAMGAIDEGDPTCGNWPNGGPDPNGGCNETPPVFQPIQCGDTICGTSAAGQGSRDLDWYEFTLTEPTVVSWEITAQYPVNVIIWPSDCDNLGDPIAIAQPSDCTSGTATATLDPGTYIAFMGPQTFAGSTCGEIYNATLTCVPTDACCDGNTGICTDNVAQDACGVPNIASGLNIDVPDGGGDTMTCASHTITVGGDAFNVSDLDVGLQMTHTWVGDLTVTLEHNSTPVVLIDRPGVPASTFGCSSNDYDIILDDEGTGGAIEGLCGAGTGDPVPTSPPNYTPNNPLSAFDGMSAQGDWTLTICDFATPDPGVLNGWSLSFPEASGMDPLFSWHPMQNCSTVDCVIQHGACCDNETGDCTDDVFEADCTGVNVRWELQVACADLNPPCEPPRGACCDDETGFCIDGLFEASCSGPTQRWARDTLCANLFPPCEPPRGACCDRSTETCEDGVFEADCSGALDAWGRDLLCADIICVRPPVPTVTQWGLIIMTMVGLVLGSILFGRRLRPAGETTT